tara:strand:+ start:523 stop:1746 length:1224 start_codon:yes stop_codon:yes gene_type:complete
MYIGITIGLQQEDESIWINGIKMNAIFLMNALLETGNKVVLLETGSIVAEKDLDEKVVWDTKRFPIKKYSSEAGKVDVLIMLGTSLQDNTIKAFKNIKPGNKVIKYACGNNYVIDMERCIFPKEGAEDAITYYQKELDEIWYVPQQGHHNHHYYMSLHNLPADKVKPIPFVWDPFFLDQACEDYMQKLKDTEKTGGSPIYAPVEDKSKLKIVVYEPNLNVVKWSMIPMLIANEYFKSGGIFGELNVLSSAKLASVKYWKSIVGFLEIWNAERPHVKLSGRYPVIEILASKADIVVAHQWDNPLNYAYLDALYLQFPVVHNAPMIKDAGYYYEGFNVMDGAEKLKEAIESHDENIESYNAQTEKVLIRYSVYNEGLVETYKKLLENLVAGENKHGLSYEYDWQTNLYK